MIRVGGNFTFPPLGPAPPLANVKSIQFIAGGVGIKYNSVWCSLMSPLISMLQHISEEDVISRNTKIALHYFVRSSEEVLFLEILEKVKARFGRLVDGHLWITRKQSKKIEIPDIGVRVHHQIADNPEEQGQSWGWWDSYTNTAMNPDRENVRATLVYICGPPGLTDRLVSMYSEQGLHTQDGHVQIEKWW
jgi:ferredoxin-NADP reductase